MEELTKETIMRASRGDMGAFEAIYRNSSGFVYNVALRMSGSYDAAAEITQDVFVKIHGELKKFRHDSAFNTWLYRITVNTSLNALKKASRQAGKNVDLESLENVGPVENSLLKQVEDAARAKELQKLLDRLPPDQKACVILRNFEDMSYDEISRTMKTNINTVRTWLKRARETLVKLAAGGELQ
ncbi:MAG: RNA polymerase sigma factor [Elusimicrobiota bacterium]